MLLLGISVSSFLTAQHHGSCEYRAVFLTQGGVCDNHNYVLAFEDNFDGDDLDFTKWKLPFQGVIRDENHTKRKQWYMNSSTTPSMPHTNNIQVSNGTIKLIAKHEQTPIVGTYVIDHSTTPYTTLTNSYNFSSAEIQSKQKFGYGKYEIRCKIPKGKGFWPAFWMFSGPGWNEIDVFEFWNEEDIFGNYNPSKLAKIPNFNMWGDENNPGGSVFNCSSDFEDGTDYSADFHVFTLIWNNYRMEWHIDGVLIRRETKFRTVATEAEVDCHGLKGNQSYIVNKAFPRVEDMEVIMNLAIESNGDAPDTSTPFPSSYEIDYFRYYKQNSCVSNVVLDSNSDLDLHGTNFNLITGNDVDLKTNVMLMNNDQLEVLAKNRIDFKPGFKAKSGSKLHGKIDVSLTCSGSSRLASSEDDLQIITFEEAQERGLITNELDISENEEAIAIYPNPIKNNLHIDVLGELSDEYQLYIRSINGSLLMSETGKINQTVIDVSHLESGLYILEMKNLRTSELYVNKIIKE